MSNKQKLVRNLSNIKDRILHYTDYKGFSKEKFFNELGISYGSFKGKAKNQALNSDIIEIIIANYPEINTEWLLTGKGDMIRPVNNILNETQQEYNEKVTRPFEELAIEEKLNQLNQRFSEMEDVHELLKLMKSKQFAMYDVFTKILKQPAIKEFLNDIIINHEEQAKKIGHKKISKNYFDELINLEENLKG